jgi:hypothetical protein
MSDVIEEYTAMQRMILECEGDPDKIGERVSGVLEFLTLRAVNDAPFIISTDNDEAIVVFAAEDAAKALKASLPDTYKRWEDELEPEFLSDQDPGDEQEETTDESAA